MAQSTTTESLQAELAKKTDDLAQLSSKMATHKADLDKALKALEPVKEKIRPLVEKRTALIGAINRANKDIRELSEKIRPVKDRVESLRGKIKARRGVSA